MMLGTMTYFSRKAGYGFVKLDNGESCFISYSEIQKNDGSNILEAGLSVELLKTANKNGLKVYKVVRP
tara:strand:+ start:259 stop:462 length:204 start_codon:yes stop_codon:yes gene_type:complete